MAGTSQAVIAGLLLAGSLACSAAVAESVPLPTPVPPRAGAAQPPAPPASAPVGAPAERSQSSGPNWLPPFFGGKPAAKPGETTAFDPKQRAAVDKVSAYLTSVQVLSGDFAQIGPDGRQAKGQFYILKPGKVRFEYEPPSPIDIVADGSSVVVRDRKLATQDLYPLSQTPLRFLLSDKIDLLRETNVVGVYADDIFVTVVIEEKQLAIGTSRLMLMVGAKDFQLKQWTVTDAQGYDTTIAVSNLDSVRKPDPGLFKIDYTRYSQ